MISEEDKYHNIIKNYKSYAVKNLNYELAAKLRDIERKYFNKSNNGKISSDFEGFNKDKMIKDLISMKRNIRGALWVIRDFQLNSLGI